jgi:hypothetical protein
MFWAPKKKIKKKSMIKIMQKSKNMQHKISYVASWLSDTNL